MTETKAKHTPGPWRVIPRGSEEFEVVGPKHIDEDDCDFIATVYGGSGENERASAVISSATARLIAAAPDLLAACRLGANMLAEISHFVPDEEFESEPNVNSVRESLEAAIAKAER